MKHSRIFRRTIIIMVGMFGIIAACTSVLSAFILYNHLAQEYTVKGVAIAKSLANANAEVLLNRDASTIQAMIDEYLDIEGVGYVFVTDSDGNILSHTFVPRVPREVRHMPPVTAITISRISMEGMGGYIDVASPILAGVAGYVHVGMDRGRILGFTRSAILKQQGLMAVIMALALYVTYLLVKRISRPLRELTAYAERLAAHDFSARVDISSDDEIGILARTMRSMAEEISSLVFGLERSVDGATHELQDTLMSMRAIIHNLADGLLVVDAKGHITHYNPALLAMYGLGEVDLTGKEAGLAFPCDVTDVAARAVSSPGEVYMGEVALYKGRVGKAVAAAIQEAVPQPNVKCLGAVVLVRDITAEKEVDRMKTDFISTVSHELRTPLTSVLGFAKIIKKRLEAIVLPALRNTTPYVDRAVDQVRDNIGIIVSEGKRLTDLINDVLDIAKMESGSLEWKMRETDIAHLINRTVAATRSLFDEKGLTCELRLADDLPQLVVDRDRITQVLVNLLSNAVKFTPDGGVTIQAGVVGLGVEISVADTGIGMAPKDQEHIFDRFRQVGDTLTEKPKGTGLGLAICKQIVEIHGGRIWVESNPGTGSVFYFYLPTGETQTCEAIPFDNGACEEALPPLSGLPRILVVDDDPHTRTYLTQVLEDEGYEVATAIDGFQALDMVERFKPHLITLDLMMPGMDGRTVIGKLRGRPDTAHIPILVISALNMGQTPGADVSLVKPVDESALLGALHGLVQGVAMPDAPCMLLTEEGAPAPEDAHYLVLCPSAVTCTLEEAWLRLDEGFQGIVFVPVALAASLDFERLARHREVQVVILPTEPTIV
ncbi:MAG: ATP-binding protein [Desulfovibrionaceae bacterium]